MDGNISFTIICVAGFSAIAFVIDSLLKYRLKSRIVKSGFTDSEMTKLIGHLNSDGKHQALKWALLLFFGGLGIIIMQVIPLELNTPLTFGIEALAIAIGFFLYYLLVSKGSNKHLH